MKNKIDKQTTILFDLDGTLIDSTEAILKCFDDSFKHFNLPTPSDDKITSLIGHPLDHMYESLGVDSSQVWDFVDVYKTHYRKRSKPMTKLLPNAVEAVKEASEFARLGVVTTKTAEYSRILLEHMGIMDYFEVLIGREDVHNPKPHPEPILKAMKLMNVTKSNNVWMIGDTCLDLLSAKAAGIRSVGVLSGYGTRTELESCSSEVLQNETLLAIKYIINSNKADIK